MAKFNLHDFVMKTIHKMITSGMEAEYKVMQYALSYYDRSVITDDDMVQISEWIAEQEAVREAEEAEKEQIAEEPAAEETPSENTSSEESAAEDVPSEETTSEEKTEETAETAEESAVKEPDSAE